LPRVASKRVSANQLLFSAFAGALDSRQKKSPSNLMKNQTHERKV